VTSAGGQLRPVVLAPLGLGGDDGAPDEVVAHRLGEGEGERDGLAGLPIEADHVDAVLDDVGLGMGRVLARWGRIAHAPCFERVLR
jgi:hypothetical protein